MAYSKKEHKHRCLECNTVWWHTEHDINAGDYDNDAAHTCPACGEGASYMWYEGATPATIHFYGQVLSGAPDKKRVRELCQKEF